jgi:hypothetical protein
MCKRPTDTLPRWLFVLAVTALISASAAPVAARRTTPVSAPVAFGLAADRAILIAQGAGAQIYECKANAGGELNWAFREPVATLVVGSLTIGRHYAGPTWELTAGDVVTARQSATAPGDAPGDIPILKLDVVKHSGDGILKDAKLVLRLNTHGGLLKGECPKAGELRAEPYSAEYAFLR